MIRFSCFVIIALSFTVSAVIADDQEKAEKQVRKITAMATDRTGRQMVSMSLADTLMVQRPLLVEERRRLGLDYGSFFVAHQLLATGLKPTDLAVGLKAGKSVWQIGNERHANWSKVAGEARKQNTRIEDYIYHHFLSKKNTEADQARDLADKYDPARDAVRTDFSVSTTEMIDAQARYVFWRDHASNAHSFGKHMSTGAEQAADMDHADAGHGTNGIAAPAAGGLPSR